MNKTIPTDINRDDDKARRLAATRSQLADASAGLTRTQARKLRQWWTHFRRDGEPETLAPAELVSRFLNPPARWARGHEEVTGFTALTGKIRSKLTKDDGTTRYKVVDHSEIIRDGVADFDTERHRFIAVDNIHTLPVLTVQCTGFSWRGGPTSQVGHVVRGELFVYQGAPEDRLLEQAVQMGLARIVEMQGRMGDISALACPAPTLVDPEGRMRLENYHPAGSAAVLQYIKPSKPWEQKIQLAVDAILEVHAPRLVDQPYFDWSRTPKMWFRANKTARYGILNFTENEEFACPVFVGLKCSVDPAARTEDGRPAVEPIGPLPEPEIWEPYRDDVLVPLMVAHPGITTHDPMFIFPEVA